MLKGGWAALVATIVMLSWPVEGRAEQGPIIVIDSWWSGDHARNACDQAKEFIKENKSLIDQLGCDGVTACPGVMPRYLACATAADPATLAFRFEDELMTQFAIDPNCKGATLTRFYGPGSGRQNSAAAQAANLSDQFWSLIIDFDAGGPTQFWTLQDHDHTRFYQGEGNTPTKVAADICAIVNGLSGATVE